VTITNNSEAVQEEDERQREKGNADVMSHAFGGLGWFCVVVFVVVVRFCFVLFFFFFFFFVLCRVVLLFVLVCFLVWEPMW